MIALTKTAKAVKKLAAVWEFICDLPDWVFFLAAFAVALWGWGQVQFNRGYTEAETAYKQKIADVNFANMQAGELQRSGSARVIAELRAKLEVAQKQRAEKQTIVKEVKKYVTEKADSQCTIPAGFVWMHDRTLAGENALVAGRAPGDVDSASGVALSTVAAVVAENNAECVYRGELIDKWQQWYREQKAIFHDAQKLIENAAKRN